MRPVSVPGKPAPSGDRRALLAKVHIAGKEMALVDESYRAILLRVTGRESGGDCTDAQLVAVLEEFKRLGWQAKSKRPKSDRPYVRLIYALWKDLAPHLSDSSEEALRSFVRRQTKSAKSPNGVGAPEWLDGSQANQVIEGLKAWAKRVGNGAENA